jgi:hypothetical protein
MYTITRLLAKKDQLLIGYSLDTGHFALEEDYDVIAEKISGFFSNHVFDERV